MARIRSFKREITYDLPFLTFSVVQPLEILFFGVILERTKTEVGLNAHKESHAVITKEITAETSVKI